MSAGEIMTVIAAMLLFPGILWFTARVESNLSSADDKAPTARRFSTRGRG